MANIGQTWGLGGRDPRRSENPEELCIFKNRKYYSWILHVCENVHENDHLSGFWAPGAFQNDPAYHFNPYSYGRSGYPMVFYIWFRWFSETCLKLLFF